MESSAVPRLVEHVAYHYAIAGADLEDLIQETRIALWEAGTKVVRVSWVLRVARNKAIDLVRRTKRIRAREQSYGRLRTVSGPEPDVEHLLRARVALLPRRLRKFYELHYVEGWSEREIAARLGICRASVRWLDHCCRRTIQAGPGD
jgi:RNA polymerase sigma-70 factor (ECF subfamily)